MAVNGDSLNEGHQVVTAESETVKEIRQSTGDSKTGDENDNDNDSELGRDDRAPGKSPINKDQSGDGCVNVERSRINTESEEFREVQVNGKTLQ